MMVARLGTIQMWILDQIGPEGWGPMSEADLRADAGVAGFSPDNVTNALAALSARGLGARMVGAT